MSKKISLQNELLIQHLLEISAGQCSITDQDLLSEEDPSLRELLAGLLMLHEELKYNKEQNEIVHSELIAARDDAERASRAKSEFLSSMSHELRTPLNAVLGFAQLLATDPDLSPDKQDSAQEIERAGQLLLKLVTEILNLSRIESGKMELAMAPLQIDSLGEYSLSLVASAAQAAGIALIDAGGEGRQATIKADAARLQQVLLNFLSNAIKYNRPGGSVRLSYELASTAGRPTVRIVVSDTGLGIPADKQSRVFGAFDRLGLENGTIAGSGIGLLISRRIIEAMGGTAGFDSVEGQGSRFWAEFTVLADSSATQSKPGATSHD